jgi:RNA polymerase-binding transcription factor DksA
VSDDTGAPEGDTVPPTEPDPSGNHRTDLDRADLDRIDLDRIAAELDAVAVALDRLDDGTYWTDEVTGRTIDDTLLDADPTRRRAD